MPQRACVTFFVGNRMVTVDEVLHDDDPIIEGRENLFEPVSEPTVPPLPPEPEATEEGDEAEDEATESDPDTMRQRLAELGIKVHPNAKPETLERKLADALAAANSGGEDGPHDPPAPNGDEPESATSADGGDAEGDPDEDTETEETA